jgi:hypothetical protein
MTTYAVIDLNDRRHLELPIFKGQPLVVSGGENRALQLAQTEHFDDMCKDLLWPGENETMFGEMLRGLVISLKPDNRWHLELLRNVAACQWRLHRIATLQRNLAIAQRGVPGRHGLPAGTLNAFEFDSDASEALADLKSAMQVYRSMRQEERRAV